MRKMYFYLFGLVLLVFLATTASSKKLIRDGLPNEYARSYVAQIQVNGIHMCGGTVISSRRHVLTAAHCVWVMRGTLFRNYDANVVTNSIYPNGTGGTFHPIEKVVVHNKYMTNRTLQDDIAIIVLKDTRESQSLRGIQLPVRNVPNGFIGTLMGWGAHAANSTAQILSKVSPQMSDRSHCLVIAPCDNLYPNNFCAKSPKGYGTCDGDSGSGLVFQDVIYGVLSSGSPGITECGTGDFDFYINVYEYLDFINSTIATT